MFYYRGYGRLMGIGEHALLLFVGFTSVGPLIFHSRICWLQTYSWKLNTTHDKWPKFQCTLKFIFSVILPSNHTERFMIYNQFCINADNHLENYLILLLIQLHQVLRSWVFLCLEKSARPEFSTSGIKVYSFKKHLLCVYFSNFTK